MIASITLINSYIGYLNTCYEMAQAKQRQLEADLAHYATLSAEDMAEVEAHLINDYFQQMWDSAQAMSAAGRYLTPRTAQQERAYCLESAYLHTAEILDPDYTAKRNAAIQAAIDEDA